MVHVVLVNPEIPWNTGNVGRTCLALGARLHLVQPLGFSLDEKAVRRAGVDYWKHVAPVVHEDWAAFAARLDEFGTPVLFSAEAQHSLYETELPANPVFIFGRESTGLPQDIRAQWRQQMVRLPIRSPHVRSLNLSTAVGIALYEVQRRRT